MAPNYAVKARGDEFFTNEQIERLTQLMELWRAAREAGRPFPSGDQAELDVLIATELQAAIARSSRPLNSRNAT